MAVSGPRSEGTRRGAALTVMTLNVGNGLAPPARLVEVLREADRLPLLPDRPDLRARVEVLAAAPAGTGGRCWWRTPRPPRLGHRGLAFGPGAAA